VPPVTATAMSVSSAASARVDDMDILPSSSLLEEED
jgi:hypothetical protein